MVKVEFKSFPPIIATVEDYKWSSSNKELESTLQRASDRLAGQVPYGYFTKPAIDNWIAGHLAEVFDGKVLSYNIVESLPLEDDSNVVY